MHDCFPSCLLSRQNRVGTIVARLKTIQNKFWNRHTWGFTESSAEMWVFSVQKGPFFVTMNESLTILKRCCT